VGEKLPSGFQRSEFLLEHGAIDMIVDRREMRDKFAQMIALMTGRHSPELAPKAPVTETDDAPVE